MAFLVPMLKTVHKARFAWLFLGLCGLLGGGLAIHAARLQTPTHDEYWHLPIGLAIWQSGKFDQDRINPPLVRLWAAVPLVVQGVPVSFDGPERESDYGDALLRAAGDRTARRYYALGRGMLLVLWGLGALLLAGISWRLFGPLAAGLGFVLWMTDPNLLAHGDLVTHDVPAAVAFLALTGGLLALLRQPSLKTAALAGLLLGLAQLVKFTAVIYYPLILLGWIGVLPWTRFRHWKQQTGLVAVMLGVSLLVINAGYLFQGSGTPLGEYPFRSARLLGLQQALSLIARVPLLLPSDYVMGLDQLFAFMQEPQPVYLAGSWSLTGFPEYYVYCWLYKTPHLQQVLSLSGMWLLLRHFRTTPEARWLLLLTLPVFLVVAITASLSANQLGYRYLLPVYPFPMLWGVGGWGLQGRKLGEARESQLVVLVAVLSVFSLRHHPNHLAYFNELAGGPANGRFLLVDSNLDWGQSLHELAADLEASEMELTGLAYFGSYPPSAVNLNVPAPPAGSPQPGKYAISLNFLQGRPHVLRDAQGTWRAVNIDEFGYFRFFEPVRIVGASIALFDLTEQDIRDYQTAVRRLRQ